MSVDAATNRILPTGATYDNNGNMSPGLGTTPTYDVANRISRATVYSNNTYYGYDPSNLRIYSRDNNGNETIYFYGADGRKLATFSCSIITYLGQAEIQLLQQSEIVYFTGILVRAEGHTVQEDRLGSVAYNGGTRRYYPYGVEYTATQNDTEKYATYTRDSVTGLDYAVNRYYSSQWGRFLSPDPSTKSVDFKNPLSWNRYTYVLADPINESDTTGLGGPCDPYGGGSYEGGASDVECTTPGSGSVSTNTSMIGQTSSDLISSEANYVVTIVVPAYLQAALSSYPTVTYAPLPAGGVSSTITFGNVVAQQTAVTSALSLLSTLFNSPSSSIRSLPPISVTGTVGVPLIPEVPITIPRSMIGVGGTLSWIPQNGSLYVGPTFSLSSPGNSNGLSVTFYTDVPSGVDPANVFQGSAATVTIQPSWLLGYSLSASPAGGYMGGYTAGTKTPRQLFGWLRVLSACDGL